MPDISVEGAELLATELRKKKVEESLKKGAHVKAMSRMPKAILVSMCTARGLDTTGVKAILAGRLIDWVSCHNAVLNISGI